MEPYTRIPSNFVTGVLMTIFGVLEGVRIKENPSKMRRYYGSIVPEVLLRVLSGIYLYLEMNVIPEDNHVALYTPGMIYYPRPDLVLRRLAYVVCCRSWNVCDCRLSVGFR